MRFVAFATYVYVTIVTNANTKAKTVFIYYIFMIIIDGYFL